MPHWIDEYTGADLAWYLNEPLLRILKQVETAAALSNCSASRPPFSHSQGLGRSLILDSGPSLFEATSQAEDLERPFRG